ncbi:RNA-dependent RNA polymerase [Jonchet virus]|uniref:RNA-directed RNA polymerase L n=1 Tax=Jonchet virus TaxID=1664809 RepID=A0A0H4B2P0_9VIRU|nr:RNA-dependent RNA polymerase [Jonchet virus]AKN56871.1 RNA-dependent RNA polymerase [Jonchet virus]
MKSYKISLAEINELIVVEDVHDVFQAYDRWAQTIKLRADASEKLVENVIRSSPTVPTHSIGDAPVNDFLSMINANQITEHKRKSPDLLIFIQGSNTLYLGDVAVTRSARRVRSIKSEKYEPLRQEISNKNSWLRVEELNVIFDEANTNVEAEIRQVSDLVGTPWDQVNIRDYTDCVDKSKVAVDRLFSTVSNVSELQELIAIGGQDQEHVDFFAGTEQMQIPKLSTLRHDEEYFANMIFRRMAQDANPDGSDQTQTISKKDTLKAISDAADANYDPCMEKVNHNLQFFVNCDEIKSDQTTIDILASMCIDLDVAQNSKIREMLPSSQELIHMKSMENEKKTLKETRYLNTDELASARDRITLKYGKSTPYYCAYKEMAKKGPRPYAEVYLNAIKEKAQDKKADKLNAIMTETPFIMPCIPAGKWEEAEKLMRNELSYYAGDADEINAASLKACKIVTGDHVNQRDKRTDSIISEIEDVIYKTRAYWLLKAVTKFVVDVNRMDPRLSNGIYYSNSLNSDTIILLHCNNSGFKTNQYFDFQCLTRHRKGTKGNEHALKTHSGQGNAQVLHVESTAKYTYILTKMVKYDIDTLDQIKDNDKTIPMLVINLTLEYFKDTYNDSSQFKMNSLVRSFITENMAFYTLLSVDLHQKPSVIMDLMKYVVSMPFSERCNFKMLLKDLLPFKTKFDVFLFKRMVSYFDWNRINAKTFRSKTFMLVNGQLSSAPGLSNKFTTFVNGTTHNNSYYHFMEGQMLNQIRPKKLYNEQFLDQACTDIIERNIEFEEEKLKYGSWTQGHSDGKDYPFEAKYCFSRDVVVQASDKLNRERAGHAMGMKLSIAGKLQELAINHLSMRKGCISRDEIVERVTKRQKIQEMLDQELSKGMFKSKHRVMLLRKELSKAKGGKSKSALLAGLEALEPYIKANDTTSCRSINVMKANHDKISQYNTSSKQQRGKGRQIASADFYTKNGLHCIEEAYKSQSAKDETNLLRSGVNRARAVSQTCEKAINEGIVHGYEHFYYLVEDQTKWSESDNVGKMKVMIECDIGIPAGLKLPLIRELSKMERRMVFSNKPLGQQPIRKMKQEYAPYITENGAILGRIGWMQGMLNFTSTDCAKRCTLWAVQTFNKYYKGYRNNDEGDIIVKSSLNSDDSFHAVAGPSKRKILDFRNYLYFAKKLFCMKLNIKKSYISSNFGEMIQLYVDGNSVLNIWMKQMYSGFGSLMGVSYEKDMTHAVSHCSTLIKQGADEMNVRVWWLTAKRAVLKSYNMNKGGINDMTRIDVDPSMLPISLFGYPTKLSQYSLNMYGVRAHNDYVNTALSTSSVSNEKLVIMMSLLAKVEKNNTGYLARNNFTINDELVKSSQLAIQCTIEPGDDANPTKHEDDLLLLELDDDNADTDFGAKQLSIVSTRLPIKHKQAEVLKKLETLTAGVDPSGVQGLIRNNNNIRTCLRDRLETSQKEMIELSESNFTTNPKLKALCNSYLASRKCFFIKGFPKTSFTALGLINHLLVMGRSAKDTMDPSIISGAYNSVSEILKDSTLLVNMIKEIERIESNNTIVMSAVKRSKVVNSYPTEIGDIDFENDISHILCEIVKPGALSQMDITMKSPHKMEAEKLIVENLYKSWFAIMKSSDGSLLKAALDIYHNELSKRISRTIISSHLDSRTKGKFFRDVYLNCYYPGYKTVSEAVLPPGVYRNPNDKVESDVNTLLALFEIYAAMSGTGDIANQFPKICYYSELTGSRKLATSENLAADITVLLSQSTKMESRRKLAVFYERLGYGTGEIAKTIRAMSYSMTWHKEQRSRVVAGRKEWYGDFRVTITKGDLAVTIEGEPGNISKIITNDDDVVTVIKAMQYLTSYASFPGFNKTTMHKYEDWGRNPFWSSYDTAGAPNGLFYQPQGKTAILPIAPLDSLMGRIPGRPGLIREGQKLQYIPLFTTTRSVTIDEARIDARYRSPNNRLIKVDMEAGKIYEDPGQLDGKMKVVGTFRVKSWFADYSKLSVNPGDVVTLDGLDFAMAISRGWAEDIIKGTTKKLEKSSVKMLMRTVLGDSQVVANTMINLFGKWCDANGHAVSVESRMELKGIPEVVININEEEDDEDAPNIETLSFTMGNTGDVIKDLLVRLVTNSTNYQRGVESASQHVFKTAEFTSYMQSLLERCEGWDGTNAIDKIIVDSTKKSRLSKTMLDALLEFGFFTRQDAFLMDALSSVPAATDIDYEMAASTYGVRYSDNKAVSFEDTEPTKEADALTDIIEYMSQGDDEEGWY